MNKCKTEKPKFTSGTVGLLGWTNVGKSTLVNLLTGMKIAITADSPQTTRNRLVGIVQSDTFQIALTDTPGIHVPRNKLSRSMLKTTWGTISCMDLVVWMVFPDKSASLQLDAFKDRLDQFGLPVVIAINKMDTVHRETTLTLADELCKAVTPVALVPISAKTGLNTPLLLNTMLTHLPEGDPLYPVDDVTDQPERVIVGEYIREHVIENTFQELPHVIAVEIEMFKKNRNGVLEIAASVIVEKNSQKGIIIGASGAMIKKIGIAARKDISLLLNTPVDLRLWIKVKTKWRNDPNKLRELGFFD